MVPFKGIILQEPGVAQEVEHRSTDGLSGYGVQKAQNREWGGFSVHKVLIVLAGELEFKLQTPYF